MEDKVCAHVVIRGRVQGVCFRMETKYIAETHGIMGWVRNRSDGTVEALFEGEKQKVDSMLKWCESGPSLSKVDQVSVNWKKYSGCFIGFEIRR